MLTELRYRWAATNPPVEALDDDRAANDRYEGVELLDAALADRFSYVLPMRRFHELSDADKVAIVRGGGCAAPNAAAIVRELVEATTDVLGAAPDALREAASQYALALVPRLSEAKITVGGRRAATVTRNVVAVWAACMALGRINSVSAGRAEVPGRSVYGC